MKKLLLLFAFTMLQSAICAQEPIDASRLFLEVQIVAPTFGKGYQVVYRSQDYRFQYLKDDAGKKAKFETVAAIFDFFYQKGYEAYQPLILNDPLVMPGQIMAFIFRRKKE